MNRCVVTIQHDVRVLLVAAYEGALCMWCEVYLNSPHSTCFITLATGDAAPNHTRPNMRRVILFNPASDGGVLRGYRDVRVLCVEAVRDQLFVSIEVDDNGVDGQHEYRVFRTLDYIPDGARHVGFASSIRGHHHVYEMPKP